MRTLFIGLAIAFVSGSALAQPLPDAELDRIHAGFIDPAGQQFAIGAVMKSYVDGTLELTSTLSWNSAGVSTSQQLGADAMPLDTAALAGYNITSSGGGAVVPGTNGATTFVHNFTTDQLTNMVVNSADNRAITQDTNITVAVPNLPALQQSMALQGLGSRLQNAMGLQQLQASGH